MICCTSATLKQDSCQPFVRRTASAVLEHEVILDGLTALRLETLLQQFQRLDAVEPEAAEILAQLAPGGEQPDRTEERQRQRADVAPGRPALDIAVEQMQLLELAQRMAHLGQVYGDGRRRVIGRCEQRAGPQMLPKPLGDNGFHLGDDVVGGLGEGWVGPGLDCDHFQASTLAVSTIDIGNTATNVIPGEARAVFNIRFNDLHSSASLIELLKEVLDKTAGGPARYRLDVAVSGESFLTPPGELSEILMAACEDVVGRAPELSTTGGTSDSRFIKDYCPVVDFGLVGKTMHQVDEQVATEDVEALSRIYERVLTRFFLPEAPSG